MQEISAKLLDTETTKNDITEKAVKLQNELESVSVQLEELERRASHAIKNNSALEAQLSEAQD